MKDFSEINVGENAIMQEFSKYDLVIDARSPREYADDHIPGAVNLPVVNDEEYAEVGTLHRTDKIGAYRIGVEYSLANIARYIKNNLKPYGATSKILVYCFRGGKRSKLWFDALETMGLNVTKLQGGWKAYRRHVNEQLANVPRQFRYNVLSGSTGCGKTRLLYALEEAGEQVLDLEAVASHRGSVLGSIPGVAQPTQKYFDSILLEKLNTFDRTRTIWVEAESKKVGNVQLPDALLETMRLGRTYQVTADMGQRVLLWREDYRHFEEDPMGMLKCLYFLRPLVGGEEYAAWEQLARDSKMPELFERLMVVHYDPAYRRSVLRNYPNIDSSPEVFLSDLSPAALLVVANSLKSST